ncbi:universal stress protein [Pseudooceanicola sp. CBS1P-1]|uniref:Universal stress protein n=1 Tax=Pseudooceanicola albus TaxID=2692189 RepID=A0A6L7GA97_9RHOB|nr:MULTISPECIES: universal stress protein [Pseudooceanicola]MBT9386384.1 universal stress protein [Pseudooceanicola endophyticus]MXN20458.1 universal stress protein [Pseudooceanicola albus]
MAYKTILTVLTDGADAKHVLARATAAAELFDAHLDVLCLGVDRTQVGYYYAGANAMVMQEAINRATEEAEALETAAKGILANSEIRWSTDTDVAQLGDIGRHLAWRARFADLVLLPRPYGKGKGAELEPITESALFEGRAPVVILPDSDLPMPAGKRVLLCWNDTPEALNAIRRALPVLKQADQVHIVVVDPPVHGPDRSDPGGMLASWLARHGISAEIEVISKTLPRISEVLVRHARDIDADLIVMGAYGHSRFREAILGGATRHMLEGSELPVFLAH